MEKSKVIILKKTKHGESDLILHALKPDGSKISLFAGGALRSKKRFGGGILEPTHYLEVHFQKPTRSRDSTLYTLKEAKLIKDFASLRSDLDRLEIGLYFVKILYQLSAEDTLDSHGLFNLLGNALSAAQSSESLKLLRLHFDIKLLAQLGEIEPFDGAEQFLHIPVSEHLEIEISDAKRLYLQDQIKYQIKRSLSDRNLDIEHSN